MIRKLIKDSTEKKKLPLELTDEEKDYEFEILDFFQTSKPLTLEMSSFGSLRISKFPRSIVIDKNSLIEVSINKNQNYAIQFDGVVEVQEKNDQNLKYVYGLSDKSINILGTDNDPKLDLFLNQILR